MLSAHEVEAIKQDVEKLKDMAGAGEMTETGYTATSQIDDLIIDKDKIRRQINTLEKQLEDYAPKRVLDGRQRDEIVKRRKALEDKFVPELETWRDIAVIRRDDPHWTSAVRNARNRPRIEPYIAEWKRLGLLLEPSDSDINNLDNLRRDG
jgi:hypothetical protein